MSKRKPPPPQRPPSGLFEWPGAQPNPFPAMSPGADPVPGFAQTPNPAAMPTPPLAASPSYSAPSSPLSTPTATQAPQQFGSEPPWTTPAWADAQSRPAMPYHPPPKKGMGVGAIIAIVIASIVGVVVVIGVLSAVAIPVFLNKRAKADLAKQAQASNLTRAQLAAPPYCGASVTPAMPASTRTYVTALIAINGAHADYTASVQSHGNVATMADVNSIITNDNVFLRTVSAIKWTNPLLGSRAQQVTGSIHNYDSALSAQVLSQGSTPSDDSDLHRAIIERSVATTGMRQALGIPQSTCRFPLPS